MCFMITAWLGVVAQSSMVRGYLVMILGVGPQVWLSSSFVGVPGSGCV